MLRQLVLFGSAQESEVDAGEAVAKRGRRRLGGRFGRRLGKWRTRRERAAGQAELMASSHRRPVDSRHPVPHAVPLSVLEAIRAINPTVDLDYLAGFDESALRLYLSHLESSRSPRGRGARWERPGDTRAIRVCRPPEEV